MSSLKTIRMPSNATLEMLSECADIIHDYREAGYPGFPDSEAFVERMMAAGVICEEAVDMLATTYPTEENV